MAIIYEDALKAQLKAKKILPVYIISGDDGYLKQLYVNKIISELEATMRLTGCATIADIDERVIFNG